MVLAVSVGWRVAGGRCRGRKELTADRDDPYLWLDDIHGAKAARLGGGAERQDAGDRSRPIPTIRRTTISILKVLDAQRPHPFGKLDHGDVFNFWQDAAHPQGLWRSTTIADYATPNPKWEMLLDVDKLAADEKAELGLARARTARRASSAACCNCRRGGGERVVREFDPTQEHS